ncbi:MAG: hypothetical protein RMI89_08960 [Gloeomargarita sp. SKYBB_i_bin120]|nr:hypothetical protein [Gloeomargarita sp. SKYG98]MCS7293083.1 hypothetical protein [Gloeomargarita sp. SKYB120]MDW8178648.1 hypothetical protein [Gloeomargarita sp. SKYBB_i_bin120]
MTLKSKKKSFSTVTYTEVFRRLGITHLQPWELPIVPKSPSQFLQQHFERLQRFDLQSSEESRKLIIDAILLEVIAEFPKLKIWKGVNLESNEFQGVVDYLVAEDKAYLDTPMVCVVEAKRDDFLQGLAQCLTEMHVCQWQNWQANKDFDIFGVVTNGEGWKYYRLTTHNTVYETSLYALSDMATVLGGLNYILRECEEIHLASPPNNCPGTKNSHGKSTGFREKISVV